MLFGCLLAITAAGSTGTSVSDYNEHERLVLFADSDSFDAALPIKYRDLSPSLVVIVIDELKVVGTYEFMELPYDHYLTLHKGGRGPPSKAVVNRYRITEFKKGAT